MPSRRTVGLDRDLMEKLKEVTRKRGMGLSPYLRKLLSEAIELERIGYYAPRALKEKRIQVLLEMFNFCYVPSDINVNKDPRAYGRRLGEAIKEIGGDVYSVIEYLGLMHKIAITHDDRITIVNTGGVGDGDAQKTIMAEILKGMAEGSGLPIEEHGATAIIEMPKELKEELRRKAQDEIERQRGRR
ncbi:MAG TPA: hypothetical protein VNL13_07530 [Sulfolobales archaeon]|nr:hypothetical protein [Sulfolobales archaeon]